MTMSKEDSCSECQQDKQGYCDKIADHTVHLEKDIIKEL